MLLFHTFVPFIVSMIASKAFHSHEGEDTVSETLHEELLRVLLYSCQPSLMLTRGEK